MLTLPVSGLRVRVSPPDGAEELLLLEAPALDIELGLVLATRLVRDLSGSPVDWESFTVTDLDTALLAIRREVLGDWIRSDTLCRAAGCGERIDISFRIADYLTFHRPRTPRNVEGLDGGAYRLRGTTLSFRLPTAGDLLAVAAEPDPERALMDRCMQPAPAGSGRRRIERAMETLAPNLAGEIGAPCPQCGSTLAYVFDPQTYVLRELRDAAIDLYAEIHSLAYHYHWPQEAILALPRERRRQFAEMIRRERGTA